MSRLRLLSLCVLLAGILLRPSVAHLAGQSRAWELFAPVQHTPRLYKPSGIAVDSGGRVYVTDSRSRALHVVTAAGEPLGEWSAAAHLTDPTGVAVGRDDAVFVADDGSGRLIRFSPRGEVVWNVSIPDGQSGGLRVAAAPSGDVYVLEAGAARVLRYSSAGRRIGAWTVHVRHKPKPTGLCPDQPCTGESDGPIDISSDGHGTIYLLLGAYTNGYLGPGAIYWFLQSWTPSGNLLREKLLGYASRDKGFHGYTDLNALVAQANGQVILGDTVDVLRLSPDWRVESQQPIAGCRGHDRQLQSLALDNQGRLFVVESKGPSIQIFSPELHPVSAWGCPPTDFYGPGGVATDAAGVVYVADSWHFRVVKLAPSGRTLAAWPTRKPKTWEDSDETLSLDVNGNIYVTRDPGNVVQVLTPAG